MKDQRCKYKESNEIKIRMKGKSDEMTQNYKQISRSECK